MTWYAQQIFAQPRENVVASLRAIPQIANAIYHVPHLRNMESKENVVDGVIFGDDGPIDLYRTVRRGPRLPADGLLVVRELCASGDEHCSEWFGEEGISWDNVGENVQPCDDAILQCDKVFADAPEWWSGIAPPDKMLRQFQLLAEQTHSVIAYYACHMWGGDVECVFGWVWDGERRLSRFYRGVASADGEGRESTGFYTDLTGAYVVDRVGRRLIVDGDVLTLILLHFGLMLRDGYFELHTRAFPWDEYKLEPVKD